MLHWINLYVCSFIILEVFLKSKFLSVGLLGQRIHAYVVFLDIVKSSSIGIFSFSIPISHIWGSLFIYRFISRIYCYAFEILPILWRIICVVLIYISIIISEVEYFFIWLKVIFVSFLWIVSSWLLPVFL